MVVAHLCEGYAHGCSYLEIKNRDTNYDPIALDRTFLVVVHSTWMGPLSGGCFTGVFLGSYDCGLR